jgi:hypothetical protein
MSANAIAYELFQSNKLPGRTQEAIRFIVLRTQKVVKDNLELRQSIEALIGNKHRLRADLEDVHQNVEDPGDSPRMKLSPDDLKLLVQWLLKKANKVTPQEEQKFAHKLHNKLCKLYEEYHKNKEEIATVEEWVTILHRIETHLSINLTLAERLRIMLAAEDQEKKDLLCKALKEVRQQINWKCSLNSANRVQELNAKTTNRNQARSLWKIGKLIRLAQIAHPHDNGNGVNWHTIPPNILETSGRSTIALETRWALLNQAALRIFGMPLWLFVTAHLNPTLPLDQAVERVLRARVNPADLNGPEGPRILAGLPRDRPSVIEVLANEVKLIVKEGNESQRSGRDEHDSD